MLFCWILSKSIAENVIEYDEITIEIEDKIKLDARK